MNRTQEAMLSRQNMSSYKTLYVEGDLDLNILEAFLQNNDIKNIRIYRIISDKDQISFGSFIQDETLGAKKRIIELIKHSNDDSTIAQNKYLGIVDLDFDFCLSQKEEISNLIYTDKNSMESYLIDKELFEVLAKENKCETFDEFGNNFENFLLNFFAFNKMFVFQLKYISELEDNVINFEQIKFGSGIIKTDYTICVDTIKHKCKNNKSVWSEIFNSKISEIEALEKTCKSDRLIFLHGKYTLRYFVGLFKNILGIYKQVLEDDIVNMLKDKFIILRKFTNFELFTKVQNFASV